MTDSDPDWRDQARALEELGDTQGALACAKDAVARDPSSENFVEYARLYLSVDSDRAAAAATRALAIDEDCLGAHFVLGVAYEELGRNAEALEAYRDGLKLGDDQTFRARAARLLWRLGRDSEAIDEYERLFGASALEDDGLFDFAVALGRSYPSRAEALIRELLTRHDSMPRLHRELGYMLWRQSRLAEAAVVLDRALELDATDPWSHNYVSTVYFELGRRADAEAAMRRAIKLDSRVPLFHGELADYLVEAGAIAEAKQSYRAGLAVDQADGWANLRYARFLESEGRTDEARRHYRVASEDESTGDRARQALLRLRRRTS